MIISHIGPPWGLFRGPHCPSGPLKGPRVVQHDTISCNIPIGSVLGPFGVIQGHFGSRRAIFGHEGPFLVLFWAILGPPWASEKGQGWSNMTYNHVIYPCWCCICRFTARNLNHKMLKYICWSAIEPKAPHQQLT